MTFGVDFTPSTSECTRDIHWDTNSCDNCPWIASSCGVRHFSRVPSSGLSIFILVICSSTNGKQTSCYYMLWLNYNNSPIWNPIQSICQYLSEMTPTKIPHISICFARIVPYLVILIVMLSLFPGSYPFFPIKIPIPWLLNGPRSKRRSRRPVIDASFQRPSMQSPLPVTGRTGTHPGDLGEALGSLWIHFVDVAVCQNLVPLVNIGKCMFIPLKMVCIGIDPYPCIDSSSDSFTIWLWLT